MHEKRVRLSCIEEGSTFPVEMKSGKVYQTKSLDRFMERYGGRVGQAYIIHPKNLQHRGQILCIPSYMAMCL